MSVSSIEGFFSLIDAFFLEEYSLVEFAEFHILMVCGLSFVTLLSLILLSTSFSIRVYTLWYMKEDPFSNIFLSMLAFFIGSMSLLFLSENFFLLFLAWEFIGISSLKLIAYYQARLETLRAEMKAITYNRLGDFGFLFALVLGLALFSDSHIFSWSLFLAHFRHSLSFWMSFPLFLACWAKSAQAGLHSWLLDAMERPTPVSALLHSATLVSANVILIWKALPILALRSSMLLLSFLLGSRKKIRAVGGPGSPLFKPPPMEGAPQAGSLLPCFHACVEHNGARHVQDNRIYNTSPPNKRGTHSMTKPHGHCVTPRGGGSNEKGELLLWL